MNQMGGFGLWGRATFGPLAFIPAIVGAVGSAAAGVGSAVAGVGGSLLGGLGAAGSALGGIAGAGGGAGGLLGGLSSVSNLASAGLGLASLATGGPKQPKVDLGAGAYSPQLRTTQRNTSLSALSPGLSLAGTNAGGSFGTPAGGSGVKTLLGQ